VVADELKGMTALVTGASRGIGAETAFALASHGAHALIHYNTNHTGACNVLAWIRAAGGGGELFQSDLSETKGIHHLLDELGNLDMPIEILVNNAGSLLKRTPFLDFTEDLWDKVITLNLKSAFLITKALLPGMVDRKQGFIVNVSSVAARSGGGIGAIAYSTAKGALSTMTKGLAREFGPKGIRINAVSPGTIDTDYHRTFSSKEALEGVIAATPFRRLGAPAEVADVVVFLCSDGAQFIQGQVVEVNGGFLMV